MRVAFVRHIGPYIEVGPVFERFMGWAGQHGLFGPGTKVIGIGHDDPHVTPADKLRFDCCITVKNDFKPEGDVEVQTIDGGDFAVIAHRGPYEKLVDSYRFLYEVWLPVSRRKTRQAPPFEVYLNSPRDTMAENLLTEIHVPLEPR
jgi:AraC family transcriptional regulator